MTLLFYPRSLYLTYYRTEQLCLETKTIKKEEELLQCVQRCLISPDLLRTISEDLFFSVLFYFV